MVFTLKRILAVIAKQYTSIGGQAVIEGVMMRSPNSFVVAVRKPDGSIRLRRDQWYGLPNKFAFLKKPFFRGIVLLIEAMANGVVSLNYSANIAAEEEMKKDALAKGQAEEDFYKEHKKDEKIDWVTFFTIILSFAFGMTLFVFVPHAATEGINQAFLFNWKLDDFAFHLLDGIFKGAIFILYIWGIGFIPDIRRVFQYHGAEHKSIATFEAGEELTVANSRKYSRLHPRCGTSFIFFLLFISIVLFSGIFSLIQISEEYNNILRHLIAIILKIGLMIPIAGISYEIIKFAGRHPKNLFCKGLSFPGMMLQKLTTKEPDDKQLEVALCSIKTVLSLEETYKLNEVNEKILGLEEVDISSLDEVENTNSSLKDFLE